MIETLKSEPIEPSVLPNVLKSLRAILEKTSSADMFRSLAMYITYAITTDIHVGPWKRTMPSSHSENGAISKRRNTDVAKRAAQDSLGPENKASESTSLTNFELGAEVLEMLAKVLIEDTSGVHAKRFAKNVTSKVLVLRLFSQREC